MFEISYIVQNHNFIMKNKTERRACVEYSFEIDNYATNAFGLIRLVFGDVSFGRRITFV